MKKILIALLLMVLFVNSIPAQEDIRARQIIIKGRGAKLDGIGNIPLYWNGFYYGTYSGNSKDAFFMNYTGGGNKIFNWQSDGQPRFTMNKPGRAILYGSLRFNDIGSYINFGSGYGSGGYGIRDDSGAIEFKSSGGAWASSAGLGTDVSFSSVTITTLTASRLLQTDGTKKLISTNLNSWIDGTANDVTVADDGDGTVTVSTVTLKDIVVSGEGMSGGADNVLPGADSDITIILTTAKDIVTTGTGLSGGADDVLPGADADVTITLDVSKDIVVTGTGMSGGEDNVLPGADADVTITLTTEKDIVVSGTGMSGGEDNVLPGADADVSIILLTAKDIVAGVGLSGGEDDVLPGADADVTLTVDTTELTSITWGAAGGAFTHTFDAGATDPIWTYGTDGTVNLSSGTLQEGGRNVYSVGGTDIAIVDGGTGVGSWTDGQLLIGDTTGNTAILATLTGTANQVVIVNGASLITFSTPQDIHTTATPTFNTLTLGQSSIFGIGSGVKLSREGAATKGFTQDFAGSNYAQNFWGVGVYIDDANSDPAGEVNDVPAGELWTDRNIGAGTVTPDELLTVGQGTKHDGYRISAPAEVQTTDATITVIDTLTLLDENGYLVKASVIARQADGTTGFYLIVAGVKRIATGSAVIVGTVTTLHASEDEATWDCTFTVSGDDVRVSVTGEVATTIEWGCTLSYMNMSD